MSTRYKHLQGRRRAGLLALLAVLAFAADASGANAPGASNAAPLTAAALDAGPPNPKPSESAASTSAPSNPAAAHFADADNAALVATGRVVYRRFCANCHGHRLEGQALWQLRDQFFHRRAPAHDETGHTWQHSDEELFQVTSSGRPVGMPQQATSYMPAFAVILSDQEILAVLAYIKARWSIGIRAAQASLNPDFRGMPTNAESEQWTLPPNCSGQLQEWKNETP